MDIALACKALPIQASDALWRAILARQTAKFGGTGPQSSQHASQSSGELQEDASAAVDIDVSNVSAKETQQAQVAADTLSNAESGIISTAVAAVRLAHEPQALSKNQKQPPSDEQQKIQRRRQNRAQKKVKPLPKEIDTSPLGPVSTNGIEKHVAVSSSTKAATLPRKRHRKNRATTLASGAGLEGRLATDAESPEGTKHTSNINLQRQQKVTQGSAEELLHSKPPKSVVAISQQPESIGSNARKVSPSHAAASLKRKVETTDEAAALETTMSAKSKAAMRKQRRRAQALRNT